MTEQPDHCPHLGLKQNRAIRFASPTPEHRCYVTGEAQEIPVDQTGYCLSPNHVKCPLYMGLDVPSTSNMVRDTSHLSQRGIQGWIASLSTRDQIIYGSLLVTLFVIVLLYAVLGVQLLTSATPLNNGTTPVVPTPSDAAVSTPASENGTGEPTSSPGADDTPEETSPVATTSAPTINLISDGSGFEEADLADRFWQITTTADESLICRKTSEVCNTGYTGRGASAGTAWIWFGRSNRAETSSVSRSVIIPQGRANLTFWLRIPHSSGNTDDFLQVSIDRYPLFRVTGADTQRYTDDYQQVSLDVTDYADGRAHTLEFLAEIQNSGDTTTSFFLDEVSLVVTERPVAEETVLSTPTMLPTSAPTVETPAAPTAPTTPASPTPTETGDTALNYHTLYFVDQTGSLLIPVSRVAAPGLLQEQMAAAVRELIAGPEPGSGLIGPVPAGTTLLDLTRDGGTITANFDRQPGNDQALTAVALTLTEFIGIHQVQIQVNGSDTGLEGGQRPIKRPILNPDNPDNLSEDFDSRETSFLPLFFRYNGYFVRITRLVPSTQTPVKATVEELLKGPGDIYDDLLTSPIPSGTELRPAGINPNDREIVVDLTQEFTDAPDQDAALDALVLSLTELRDSEGQHLFSAVEVRVEGSDLDRFWGSNYDGLFERPLLNLE